MSIDVQTEIRNTCLYAGGMFQVIMAMADCANSSDGTGIYPGVDILAANSRLAVRQTQENIKLLRKDRTVILVVNGEDQKPDVSPVGGRGRFTEYRIDLERVQELQSLHEAEEGVCALCEARQKRKDRRAQKGAVSSRKGASGNTKGAVSTRKGAICSTPIEEPSLEPSVEPTNTPRAREAGAPLGEEALSKKPTKPDSGFDRFWTEVRNHWPGDHAANKHASQRTWDVVAKAGELRPPGDMAGAARAEGRNRQAAIEAASKRKGDRPPHTKSPSSWLLDRCFVGLLDEPAKPLAGAPAPLKTFDEIVDTARVVIAPEHVEGLRRQGLSDAEIAEWFSDAEFVEDGFILRAGTRYKSTEIQKRWGRQVGRVFGVAPEYVDHQFRRERAAR